MSLVRNFLSGIPPGEEHTDKVSQRIKEIRAQKGIPQAEMAKALDLDRSNYHRIENRGEKLSVEVLDRIARTLDVPLELLITGKTRDDLRAEEQELISLRQRVADLEEQLRDKQKLMEFYEARALAIRQYILDMIYMTAVVLNMTDFPLDRKTLESCYAVWGEDQFNENGERVLVFGVDYFRLDNDALTVIFDYLSEHNPQLYHNFQDVAFEVFTKPSSLIRTNISARLFTANRSSKKTRFEQRQQRRERGFE